MKYLEILILIVLVHTAAYGQDSLNCRLLTTTDLVSPYALEVKDNFAFTGFLKFSILNTSDIYNPILVYNGSVGGNFINSICIIGDYGYLAVNYGLIILDLSSYESPIVLSHLITNEFIEAVIVVDSVAYLGTMSYAFLVIDVSDPQNPYEINRIDENIDDVWKFEIYNDMLFAASEDTGVKIFDISVPANPIELATLNPQNFVVSDMKIKDNIVYATSPHLYSFDISDINNPQLLDILEGAGGHAIDIEGNYAYCTSNSRLSVIDISNAADLKVAGYYPLPSPGINVFVKNKIVHVACQTDGIYFIQFDEPTFIKEVNNNLNDFSLSQNYPNPFNPNTLINYSIPKADFVILKVYDILGNEISTLLNEYQEAGSYKVKFSVGQNSILSLSSGIYYYRIISGDYSETKKMLLIK